MDSDILCGWRLDGESNLIMTMMDGALLAVSLESGAARADPCVNRLALVALMFTAGSLLATFGPDGSLAYFGRHL